MNVLPIRCALVSVYHKEPVLPLVQLLHKNNISLIATGKTHQFIEQLGLPVRSVESVTKHPELLDGRVKTLHPHIFGAILARNEAELQQLHKQYDVPPIDLVVVELYPFADHLHQHLESSELLELIDIGGVALIRAAAKNFPRMWVCASPQQYDELIDLLTRQGGSTLEDRRRFAAYAFTHVTGYDAAIANYLAGPDGPSTFWLYRPQGMTLRYGENPHQKAEYFGSWNEWFEQLHGKPLSYNNLLDIDAAVGLIEEFSDPTCAIIKHTNACGCASGANAAQAWQRAWAADPQSAFGGIVIFNTEVDAAVALLLDHVFFEILIARGFSGEALSVLSRKKNRILLRQKAPIPPASSLFRSLLADGVVRQDGDRVVSDPLQWKMVTQKAPNQQQSADLVFAEKCVKHLKSNAVALVSGQQLIGMGCGQPSRIDAVRLAIAKAQAHNLPVAGSVMASDAFFPFPDSVEFAGQAGVAAILQPGGSRNDQACIDACNRLGIAMVFTGIRHFRH